MRHGACISSLACVIGLLFIYHAYPEGLAANLFGDSMIASLGALMVAGAVLFPCMQFLSRSGMSRAELGMFLLFAATSLFYIHLSDNYTYTNDLEWHIARMRYFAQHPLDTYGYQGYQAHHPPLYYYFGAVIVLLSEQFSFIPLMLGLRFLSWVSYLGFAIAGMLLVKQSDLRGVSHYAALALILLWPAAYHMAPKIGPEPLYYALYAMGFYKLTLWHRNGNNTDLRWAVVFAALALMTRTNAVIMFAIIGVVVLSAVIRRKLVFTRKEWLPTLGVAVLVLAAIAINAGTMIAGKATLDNHLGLLSYSPDIFSWQHYLSVRFHYALVYPVSLATAPSFWDYLLRTSIFGEYGWPNPGLAALCYTLLVSMLLLTILAWCIAPKDARGGVLPHVANIALSIIFLMVFTAATNNYSSSDARYIYPVILSVAVLFARGLMICARCRLWPLVWMGLILLACFTLSGLVFFLAYPR